MPKEVPKKFVSFLALKNPQPKKRSAPWEKMNLILSSVSSVVIAVFAVVSAVVATMQWSAMRDADVTTRESFTNVQRPFVIGKDLNVSDEPLYKFFRVTLENNGNTPTRNAVVTVKSSFALTELNNPPSPDRRRPLFAPRDPEESDPTNDPLFAESRIVLAPKAIALVGTTGIPIQHLTAMADKRADGYVYGFVNYEDTFTKTTKHTTKFCFVVVPVKDGDGSIRISYGLCQHWNCADEECANDKAAYQAKLTVIRAQRP